MPTYIAATKDGRNISVEFVSKGIANRFDDRIEVHEKLTLPRYKPLLIEIIKHELNHSDRWWSIYDLRHDIGAFKNRGMYWRFVLTTPSSWIQFLPIYPSKGKWYFDITLIIFYIVFGGLIGYAIYRYIN